VSTDKTKTLADVFAEEPADGTHLAVWRDRNDVRVVWRDDREAKRWGERPDERWFDHGNPDGTPMGFREMLADATQVLAVVPLDESGLALVDEEG
jgi:hypothetical protein